MEDGSSGKNAEMQEAYRKKLEEMQKRQAAEAQIKAVVNKLFDAAAIERLNNIRLSNQELYLQVVQYFASLYQAGRISGKVTEEQVRQAVTQALSQRRETTIRRL